MFEAVAKAMMKQRSGCIINMASIAGLTGNPSQANYSAAKAGLIGLTMSMAKELASRSIRVNAIAPGFIQTEMTDKLSDKVKEVGLAAIPMKHFGAVEEVAWIACLSRCPGIRLHYRADRQCQRRALHLIFFMQ